MPGFGASIVLAFISGVELFDYVVDGGGGESVRARLGGGKANGGYGLKMGKNQIFRASSIRSINLVFNDAFRKQNLINFLGSVH